MRTNVASHVLAASMGFVCGPCGTRGPLGINRAEKLGEDTVFQAPRRGFHLDGLANHSSPDQGGRWGNLAVW